LVALQLGHLQIANNRIVFVRCHLEDRLFAVEGDIDQKFRVCQDPLQCRSELLVVIHDEDGFQLKRVVAALVRLWFGLRFHGDSRIISAAIMPTAHSADESLAQPVENCSPNWFHPTAGDRVTPTRFPTRKALMLCTGYPRAVLSISDFPRFSP